MSEVKIKDEKIVFDDTLIIQKGKITNDKKTYSRFRIKREDAAVVFILNVETKMAVLTRQFRYPIIDKTDGFIVEAVAGKVDEGEEPLQTAVREAKEETGYKIRAENIKFVSSCFSSPGYSSECFFIYIATVTNADKVSAGGGKKSENENVEVIEMPIKEFLDEINQGNIIDAKTYLLGLYLQLHFFHE